MKTNINRLLLVAASFFTIINTAAQADIHDTGAMAGTCTYEEVVNGQSLTRTFKSPLLNPYDKIGIVSPTQSAQEIIVFMNDSFNGKLIAGVYTDRFSGNPPIAAIYSTVVIDGRRFKVYRHDYSMKKSEPQVYFDLVPNAMEFFALKGVGFDRFYPRAYFLRTQPNDSEIKEQLTFSGRQELKVDGVNEATWRTKFNIDYDSETKEAKYLECTFHFVNRSQMF